jgi:signal transduction histidine kinase
MIKPDIPSNDKERLKELMSYEILDSLPEKEYDDITRIASQICQTKVSLISLVDEDRQWFKSHHGIDATETPREHAFCAHAINNINDVLEVEDSRKDERFHDNPLVVNEPHVVFYTGVPLVSPDGYALGTLCVIDDVPKKLDKEQVESLKALASQVIKLLELRKRHKLLKEANFALEEKYKELEKFALIAAHDIKSPLNNISTIISFIIDEHSDKLDNSASQLLKKLDNSADQLRKLVDGILSYSRSEKVLSRNQENVDLKEFIEDIIALLKTDEIQFEYPKHKITININKIALKQILLNLVSNAIKYNDKERIKIEIGFEDKGKFYEFFVKDNGPGIKKEYQERIFNIFEILHTSDREGNRGSGVGLATVKKLVDGQNGKIWLISEIDKGSSFYFSVEK